MNKTEDEQILETKILLKEKAEEIKIFKKLFFYKKLTLKEFYTEVLSFGYFWLILYVCFFCGLGLIPFYFLVEHLTNIGVTVFCYLIYLIFIIHSFLEPKKMLLPSFSSYPIKELEFAKLIEHSHNDFKNFKIYQFALQHTNRHDYGLSILEEQYVNLLKQGN